MLTETDRGACAKIHWVEPFSTSMVEPEGCFSLSAPKRAQLFMPGLCSSSRRWPILGDSSTDLRASQTHVHQVIGLTFHGILSWLRHFECKIMSLKTIRLHWFSTTTRRCKAFLKTWTWRQV